MTRIMNVVDVMEALELRLVAGRAGLEREVRGGYCGDLLSDVMARAKPKDIWVTIQGHQNVVAVAVLTEVAGVVICGSAEPEAATLERADREGIPILRSAQNVFEVCGKLYSMF